VGDVSSLGQASPPWLLWGQTQTLTIAATPGASALEGSTPTLIRIAYGRPETWRFLFAARIISAPETGAGEHAQLNVWFELITGIGRSAIQIPFFSNIPDFVWDGGLAVPEEVRWTNLAYVQGLTFLPATPIVPIDTITGQDMTVVAHVRFATDIISAPPCVCEVSAQFAPNVHVRPDWSRIDDTPLEQFPGGEVGGR
jgi:hypothetical protein